MSNELQSALSPYLLQHAENPVHWKMWSENVFEQAKMEDKPILLSIGYSACHWCHVMSHESFEDVDVANILNQDFISIKVDREERPDIDAVYMEACQMMTGRGGWPLTIILTPDKKVFFAGTYFPKISVGGRPGFIDILHRVSTLWSTSREKIQESSNTILEELNKRISADFTAEIDGKSIDKAINVFQSTFDERYGGFSTKPKFPSAHQYVLLLRYALENHHSASKKIVKKTLKAMHSGGIYDHIGFGFHRYSTDEQWLLPHFEKMLYDQAMAAWLYTEAYQTFGNAGYKKTVLEIYSYINDRLTSKQGLYYSAEDADSEGKEGKYYVWTLNELRQILHEDDAEFVVNICKADEFGNFRDESTQLYSGENIIHWGTPPTLIAEQLNLPVSEIMDRWERCRKCLYDFRSKRVAPELDDKILTDWNGLIIASMAFSGRVFDNNDLLDRAQASFWALLAAMWDAESRTLFHAHKNGKSYVNAMLDDYACVGWAALELYQSTGNEQYLQYSVDFATQIIELFYDKKHGGFYQTAASEPETPFKRQKQYYDGALPSGNSIAAYLLSRLGVMISSDSMIDIALSTIQSVGKQIQAYPTGFSWLLCTLMFLSGRRQEIVLSGEKDTPLYDALKDVVQQSYLPNSVLIYNNDSKTLKTLIPKIDLMAFGNTPTVSVCENFACNKPISDVCELQTLLTNSSLQ